MTADALFYVRTADAKAAISELSTVALRDEMVLEDARVLPVDAEGTVVGLWGDGRGCVVEFDAPFHVVASVEAENLREIVRFEM
ncbi:hypothetical protein Q8W71_16935 [Methylobacterium sp. NEAU 140]|uniref:hypothetical protein n=1 Tax=Methylobacterium sp. NEAU 140 TaxID=3064945 RepID=UPI002732D6E7|nr:hypothetical protein [Methylobacterium sp. NEAU 140]MDP4024314.1 hypothetical protein [Methylobacterium sp. NEAU 140]